MLQWIKCLFGFHGTSELIKDDVLYYEYKCLCCNRVRKEDTKLGRLFKEL
jgi:hypothetical protein